MHKNWLLAIGMVFGWTLTGWSQHLPGASMGNYAGTNALYHNPAFVADSRYRVYINVAASQLYTANNHVRYEAPFSFFNLLTNTVSSKYRSSRGVVQFPRSYLGEKLNGNQKYLNAGGDTRLPSVMFSMLKGKLGAAVSLRARYILNASGITEDLARLISKTTQLKALQGPVFNNQSGQLHFNGLGEIAFTLGGTVMDNESDFLKVGVTAKGLLGLYNAHAIIENSSFNVLPDASWENKRQYININEINVRYAMTRDEGLAPNGRPPGIGWGFDIGAVYEYRPDVSKYSYYEKGERKKDHSKNKYLYRIAVSLTDIGRVHFNNPAYILQQETHAVNKEFRFDDFQKLDGSEGFFNAINNSLDGGPTIAPDFRSVLPAAFQASVDYNVKPNVYVSGLWVQNLVPQNAFGMKAESTVTVTPRYEHKWYELSVPLSLMNRYRSPAIGLAGRAGPLWIGTDHLAGLLNIGNPKAFNVYFGIAASIYHRSPESQNKCWPPQDSWLRRIFNKR